MSKNYILEIVKMLGLEIDEEIQMLLEKEDFKFSDKNYFTGSGTFPKYELTEEEINEIATVAYGEQGDNIEALYAEVSQMANLNEVSKGKPSTGEALLSTLHSGWYAQSSWSRGKSESAVQAVKDVLINGYRTLPRYVVEHDYIGDISHVSPGDKNDRSTWIPHVTVIYQGSGVGGGHYIYYSTPGGSGDPFGYFEGTREKYGDDCYTVNGALQNTGAYSKTYNAVIEAIKNELGTCI